MKNIKFLFLLTMFSVEIVSAQTVRLIQPSATDTLIDGTDTVHYVAINTTSQLRNKLLLFFPGTGGRSEDFTFFLNLGANEGYHTIGLSYENAISPEYLCYSSPDTTCFTRARNEILFGYNQHMVINVDTANSIYYRTVALLNYLSINYPSENWGQFLDSNNDVIWGKVVTAGASQGGNHAAFISKLQSVDRCLIFSSREWSGYYQEPAAWVQSLGLTSDSAYFGFVHQYDSNGYGPNGEILQNWAFFNMDNFGPLINTDTIPSPYQNSHMLSSIFPQPLGDTTQNYYHKTVLRDEDTPLDSNGIPVYMPVWKYMLGVNAVVSVMDYAQYKSTFVIFPNPSNGLINIKPILLSEEYTIEVFNSTGQNSGIYRNTTSIDLSAFPNGLYFMKIQSGNEIISIKIIKQ